ncbi:hypothetical protein MCEMSEM23_00646 [Rhabdaerophilaceae bacterium]
MACRSGRQRDAFVNVLQSKVNIASHLIKHDQYATFRSLQGFQHRAIAPGAVFSFFAALLLRNSSINSSCLQTLPLVLDSAGGSVFFDVIGQTN